jgi:hypothetical protein
MILVLTVGLILVMLRRYSVGRAACPDRVRLGRLGLVSAIWR